MGESISVRKHIQKQKQQCGVNTWGATSASPVLLACGPTGWCRVYISPLVMKSKWSRGVFLDCCRIGLFISFHKMNVTSKFEFSHSRWSWYQTVLATRSSRCTAGRTHLYMHALQFSQLFPQKGSILEYRNDTGQQSLAFASPCVVGDPLPLFRGSIYLWHDLQFHVQWRGPTQIPATRGGAK